MTTSRVGTTRNHVRVRDQCTNGKCVSNNVQYNYMVAHLQRRELVRHPLPGQYDRSFRSPSSEGPHPRSTILIPNNIYTNDAVVYDHSYRDRGDGQPSELCSHFPECFGPSSPHQPVSQTTIDSTHILLMLMGRTVEKCACVRGRAM